MNKEFEVHKVASSVTPIKYNENCINCNRCVEVCQCDILFPNPEGKHPIVMYPGECYYCGSCVMVCPTKAISLHHPLMNQAKFVEVE